MPSAEPVITNRVWLSPSQSNITYNQTTHVTITSHRLTWQTYRLSLSALTTSKIKPVSTTDFCTDNLNGLLKCSQCTILKILWCCIGDAHISLTVVAKDWGSGVIFLYMRAKHSVSARYRKAQNSVTCVMGVGDMLWDNNLKDNVALCRYQLEQHLCYSPAYLYSQWDKIMNSKVAYRRTGEMGLAHQHVKGHSAL